MVILVKLLQSRNIPNSILVNLFGIAIVVKLLQPSNAQLPIFVTLFSIVTLVKLLQPSNALLPMLVAPVIITILSELGTWLELYLYELAPNIYPKCVLLVPSLLAPTNGIAIVVKLLQPENALRPILVTLFGIVMLVRLQQLKNTLFPILVTPFLIITLDKFAHPLIALLSIVRIEFEINMYEIFLFENAFSVIVETGKFS